MQINEDWPTDTDTITDPGAFNLDADFGAVIAIGIVIFVAILISYKVITTLLSKREKEAKKIHFNLNSFLSNTKLSKLAKYNQMFLIVLVGVVAAIFAPPMGMNAITNDVGIKGFGSAVGWALSGLVLYLYYLTEQKNEIAANANSIWIDVEVYVVGRGWVRRLWRRVAKRDKIKLTKHQVEEYINQLKALIKLTEQDLTKSGLPKETLEIMKKMKIIKTNLGARLKAKHWEMLRKRMLKGHAYRCVIDAEWSILLILPEDWDTAFNLRQAVVFDETTEVRILRTRLDVVYLGETNFIYDGADEKGAMAKQTVASGIFLATYCDSMADNTILAGGFTAPDSLDGLFAELKHLHQQNTITAVAYNRKVGEVTKLRKDLSKERSKRSTEAQDEVTVLTRGWKRLFMPVTGMEQLIQIIIIVAVSGFFWWWLFGAMGLLSPAKTASILGGGII